MKLHADRPDQFSITAYGPGWIAVNGERHSGALLLSAFAGVRPWACPRFEDLAAGHFEAVLTLDPVPPEVVLFGSGARLRFAHPALLRPLFERRIGVETMDTAAACRTFNILAAEGRSVVAALFVD